MHDFFNFGYLFSSNDFYKVFFYYNPGLATVVVLVLFNVDLLFGLTVVGDFFCYSCLGGG